jgi:hypothetical protein
MENGNLGLLIARSNGICRCGLLLWTVGNGQERGSKLDYVRY